MADEAIARELGSRLRQLRLNRNLTRRDVATSAGCTEQTIAALERGAGKLVTMVAVLRVLGALDQLDVFLPPTEVSPMDMLRMRGKIRLRARPPRTKPKDTNAGVDW